MLQDQLARHQRNITGRGEVSLGRKAGAVDKVRVVHAQLLRTLVHAGNKRLLASGQMLAQRHGCVVARNHAHCLDQLLHAHLLSLFQPDLAAAHGGGVSRAGHRIVVGQRAGIDRLHRQQQRHHLGDAGRLARRVFVLCVKHRAGALFHQQRRGRVERKLIGARGYAQKQAQQQKERQKSFHGNSPFLVWQKNMKRFRRT